MLLAEPPRQTPRTVTVLCCMAPRSAKPNRRVNMCKQKAIFQEIYWKWAAVSHLGPHSHRSIDRRHGWLMEISASFSACARFRRIKH